MRATDAFEDWAEAEAMVVALRRSARAAAARAVERAHDAAMLLRAGRRDSFAAGVADAARVLAQRAAAEERRLEQALRVEAALRARVAFVPVSAADGGRAAPVRRGGGPCR
jgi:hypothetical protein